jgi:hypothetical protein
LLEALGSDENVVRDSAAEALRIVTRRDFPVDKAIWSRWWKDNQGRARFEWLIDALAEGDDQSREAASKELRDISGQDFGYHVDLTADGRARVQSKYRSWWKAQPR